LPSGVRAGGVCLLCDHYVGGDGMSNGSLYMTIEEQRAALQRGGFVSVARLFEMKGLVLHPRAAPRDCPSGEAHASALSA
jgi:hypothetical protein